MIRMSNVTIYFFVWEKENYY